MSTQANQTEPIRGLDRFDATHGRGPKMIMDITEGCVLGSVVILAAASNATVLDWHSIVTDFGFPIALVLFFVWAAWKREERVERASILREERMAGRVTQLEMFVQTDLLANNARAVSAITDNTTVLTRLAAVLETKPCLYLQGQANAPEQRPPVS